MEFKQPRKQTRRSTLNIPERSDYSSVVPHTLSAKLPSSQKKPLKTRVRTFLFAKPTIITSVVVICGIVAFVLVRAITNGRVDTAVQTPTYTTVLPKEKSINSLGGWKRVSPQGKEPVYAFTDMVDDVPISVSEQPLPASFKTDANGQVAEVAQKFNATEKIDADGMTVYIGTSSKGPQSVIFTKNNLLILIKSEKKIENASWANYAKLLN